MSAVLLPVTAFVLWRVFFCVEMACPCGCRRLAVKGVDKSTLNCNSALMLIASYQIQISLLYNEKLTMGYCTLAPLLHL